jgi:hypothetical protein
MEHEKIMEKINENFWVETDGIFFESNKPSDYVIFDYKGEVMVSFNFFHNDYEYYEAKASEVGVTVEEAKKSFYDYKEFCEEVSNYYTALENEEQEN